MANQPDGSAIPSWRAAARPAVVRQTRRRAPRMTFAALALIVLVGSLIAVVLWLRLPRTAGLTIIGAGYEQNLAFPHNAPGMSGLRRLAELAGGGEVPRFWNTRLLRLHGAPRTLSVRESWDAGLDGFVEPTIVLYFCTHGAADEHGAFLIPNDASADPGGANRLRVRDVLDRVARLPAGKRKLLVFDVGTPDGLMDAGFAANGFARALAELEPQIAAIPELVVLCAAGPGQHAWSYDGGEASAFGHFFQEGLRGAAPSRTNVVDAGDLFGFVGPSVATWVRRHRAAVQEPFLLPGGKQGDLRAARIRLVPVQRYSAPPPPADAPLPPELTAAWTRSQKLSERVPAPESYSPERWRIYRETLLRYTELLRDGDSPGASTLAQSLADLERSIDADAILDAPSASASLSLPEITGAAPASGNRGRSLFEAILKEPALDKRDALWKQATAEAQPIGPVGVSRLRRDVSASLLEYVAGNPREYFATGIAAAGLLRPPGRPLPAELHLALMVARDLPVSSPPPAAYSLPLQRGFHVRLAAEAAAAGRRLDGAAGYGERLRLLLKTPVEAADAERRIGEDLLFASDAGAWRLANERLAKAEAGYAETNRLLAAPQEAFRVRDRVLADLPFLTRWLMRRAATDAKADGAAELAIELWRAVDRLTERLSELDSRALADLPTATKEVRDGLDRLRAAYLADCNAFVDVDQAEGWRSLNDALAAPLASPALVMKMLAAQNRVARLFAAVPDSTPLPEPPPLDEAMILRRAKRQAALGMAMVGESTFAETAAAGRPAYAALLKDLAVAAEGAEGWIAVQRVAEETGRRSRERIARIEAVNTPDGLAAANSSRPLASADLLGRRMEAASLSNLRRFPSALLRQREVADMLDWHATRARADYWYSEDPGATPYYQVVSEALRRDAARLRSVGTSAAVPRRAAEPTAPVLVGESPSLIVTSERSIPYRCSWRTELREGRPVFWGRADKSLEFRLPAVDERVAGDVDPAHWGMSFLLAPTPSTPTAAKTFRDKITTEWELNGLHRGLHRQLRVPVEIHPDPDFVLAYPPPQEGAALSVRAAPEARRRFGSSKGAVAFVLDCSGSMGAAEGAQFTSSTKYAEATRVLRDVLLEVPRGTMVSLWIFGQAGSPSETVTDAERTITRLQAPTPWDPDDSGQLQDLMSRIEYPAVRPWNETPLARAILSAAEDLPAVPGQRMVVALTDGRDNRFDKDAQLNPTGKLDISAVLGDRLRNSDVSVNIVGFFKGTESEEPEARKQFQFVADLPNPGRFVSVANAEQLTLALKASLRLRLTYSVAPAAKQLSFPPPALPLDATLDDDPPPLPLAAGGYDVWANASRRIQGAVELDRGDHLLLDLLPTAKGLAFQRGVYSRTGDFINRPAVEIAGWRLAVLEARRVNKENVQLLAALERLPRPEETVFRADRAPAVWFKLSQGASLPTALRVVYQPGSPAPEFRIQAIGWPSESTATRSASAQLDAWWTDQAGPSPAAPIRRSRDFPSLASLAGQVVHVGPDQIDVESLSVEEQAVETATGGSAVRSALVVRLHHPLGRPVWVELEGLRAAGVEHRYYSAAGAYTGVFWPVTSGQAEAAVKGLRIVSVAAFQQEAQRQRLAARVDRIAIIGSGTAQ